MEPRTEGQAFEVRTEYAVVTVVGTEFVVDHRPGDRTVVEGISGEVRVASLDGRLLGVVRAGDVLAVPAPQVVTASVDAEEPPSADLAAESEVADSLEVTDSGVGDGAASGGDEAAPPRGDGMERPRVAEAAAGSGLGRAGKPQGRPDEGPGTAAASRQLIHASTGSPPPSGRAEPRAGKTTAAVAGQGSGTDQGLSAGEPPQGSEPEPSSGAPVEPEGAPVAPDDLTPVAEPAPEVTPDAIPKATPEPTPEEEALAPETAEVPPGQAPALPPVDVVEQATALLAAGKDAQAVALLEAAPAGSWRVAAALGDAYAVIGRPAAAAAAYRDALSRKGAPSERVVAALATVLDKSSPAEALTVWRGYLRDYPKGRMAARARLTLAKASLKGGEVAAARSELESLLASHPGTPQATTALALLGRTLLDQRMWSDAGRLFQSHVSSTTPARAEIALVGLIRVRLGQGDRTEAGSLIAQYDRRFPRGARREEVAHLRLALEPR